MRAASTVSTPSTSGEVLPRKRAPPSTTSSSSENGVNATLKKKKVVNPYIRKKPFVGGAQAARQAARKKARTPVRIMTPAERQRLEEVLPINMNPMERFSAALLRSSPEEFLQSEKDGSKALALWKKICHRLHLPVPEAPLLPCYDRDSQQHFSLRAALVMEEARCVIAQSLAAKYDKGSKGGVSMVLTAQYLETNYSSGHTKIVFRKDAPFTREELFHLRSGTVLECQVRDGPRTIQSVILATIFSAYREQTEAKREFSATTFRQLPLGIKQAELLVRPVDTLVTQLRSYEAMTMRPEKIAFLHNLLGKKSATHTRFDEDGGSQNVTAAKSITDFFQPIYTSKTSSTIFRLPKLNPTQEKAAATFLKSKSNTLTLIQGPPGTGA